MLNDILASLHELPSPLSTAFFSDQNIASLQQGIINNIKQTMGHTITAQNQSQVLIVMKYVYRNRAPFQGDMASQVAALTAEALTILTEDCMTGIKQYLTWQRDRSTQPVPLPQPVMTSVVGTKAYSTSGQLPTSRPGDPLALAW